jgi:hypothetical protein
MIHNTIRYGPMQQSMQQSPQSFVGIDISKDHLDVFSVKQGHSRKRRFRKRRFGNTPKGHRALIGWLGNDPVEASGRYSIDVALALVEAR